MTQTAPLRLAFAGTPDFAVPALRALIASEHQLAAVLTQPDRPAGRGRKLTASPIKKTALAAGVPVLQPDTLRDEAIQAAIDALELDLMIVAAYGLILPQVVLDSPNLGCWNIHASLLPRWRGAAPIHRAILAGDEQTGVCIMQMEAGLDTGPVLLADALPIRADDTTGSLHDRLADLGSRLIIEAIDQRERLSPQAQSQQGVTYAEKLSKQESQLDWQQPAVALERKIRALDPWPVAATDIHRQRLRIWAATVVEGSAPPGYIRQVSAEGIDIGTGDGILRITALQKPGARRLPVGEFLNANPIPLGYVDGEQSSD